ELGFEVPVSVVPAVCIDPHGAGVHRSARVLDGRQRHARRSGASETRARRKAAAWGGVGKAWGLTTEGGGVGGGRGGRGAGLGWRSGGGGAGGGGKGGDWGGGGKARGSSRGGGGVGGVGGGSGVGAGLALQNRAVDRREPLRRSSVAPRTPDEMVRETVGSL